MLDGLSPSLGGTRLGSRQELSELSAGESPQLPCRDREQHRPPRSGVQNKNAAALNAGVHFVPRPLHGGVES
ncbi:MAG: hypothetical protein SGPRY_000033 [Prymnesium sp.]